MLRDRLADVFEREADSLLRDPWGSRDRFVDLILDPERGDAGRFLRTEAARPLVPAERVKVMRLLEMQRQAMLMYTSCGWFFSELSGLETVQVLKYAARAIQLARDAAGVELESEFRQALRGAPSNVQGLGDGGRVYDLLVQPSVVSLEGVGAHLAIASLVKDMPESGWVFCYRYKLGRRRRTQAGHATLALGRLELESIVTGEALDALFCVHPLRRVRLSLRRRALSWRRAARDTRAGALLATPRLSLAQLLREVDRFFAGRDYTLRDLFLDERRRVADALLADTMRRYEADYLESSRTTAC